MRPRPSPLSSLVRASAVVLGLSVAPVALAAPAKLPPNIPRPSVDLEPDGAGRLKHRGDGFTAIIHPDGSVEFRDHGGTADINFLGLDLWRRRLREPEPERQPPWFMGVVDEALYSKRFAPYGPAPILAAFGARFGGLADGRRKNRHKSAKQAFMIATEQLRFHLANAWYKQRLRSELADLGGQLLEVWRDAKLPLTERKRRIFERWEECEDATSTRRTDIDDMRLDVARTARAKIEAFVRQVAPLGSPQAFTDEELDRFNAGRAGKTRFRPYDAPVLPQDINAEAELGTAADTPRAEPPPPDPLPPAALPTPVGPDPGPGFSPARPR
ncbi:hypothetical protein [Nannocystis punicea]|uniref:Uncharacterized protein n=1 Tax=Nannocystis punicea TaxID=2995304 RepID=A0ABY7HFS2_9BACT|nr:hypothetical protein [Nannocystis poenicansa]WAS98144.1 hypothetical protein O0S08_18550 [Nannocystis poenicansa]